MSDTLEASEALVKQRYKTALLFSFPLFASFALLLLDSIWGISLASPASILGGIVAGLLIGAIPVTRWKRARNAYDRKVREANFAAIAEALERET